MSDFILGNDSDFAMYVEPSRIFIRSIKLSGKRGRKKKNTTTDLEFGHIGIGGGDNKVMEKLQQILTKSHHIELKSSPSPFLSSTDPVFWSYTAIASGCDAFPGGIGRLGPSIIYKALQPIELMPDVKEKFI